MINQYSYFQLSKLMLDPLYPKRIRNRTNMVRIRWFVERREWTLVLDGILLREQERAGRKLKNYSLDQVDEPSYVRKWRSWANFAVRKILLMPNKAFSRKNIVEYPYEQPGQSYLYTYVIWGRGYYQFIQQDMLYCAIIIRCTELLQVKALNSL